MNTTRKIQDQVQAGIDARLAVEPLHGDELKQILAVAGARMLGLDGTSVEEAARQAVVAGGPSVEELQDRIRERRRAAATPARAVA